MTTTTNVGLSTPAHGSNVNTWSSDPVNDNSGIIDNLFGSVTTKSLTNVNVNLSTTESQVSILRFTGTLTGNVVIKLGAIIKSWIVENNTLGAFTITVQGFPATGNVVGLPEGSCQIYWDGTNVSFINLGRVGEYWDDAGATVPAWVAVCTVPPALLCDGSTFSAVTYPLLNKRLGGTTLPDARGRTRFALNGGTGRLTTAGGIDGDTRFAAGGYGVGLTIGQANLPNVNFGLTINDARTWATSSNVLTLGVPSIAISPGANYGAGSTAVSVSGSITGTAASGGSGTVLPSVPPGYVGGITMLWAK